MSRRVAPTNPFARSASRLPMRMRRWTERLPGAWAPPVEPGTPTPTVAIIGTGFGGIAMAARLRQAGIDSFTIFEKAERVGGTWRDNTYPGAACDVPSHLYSLSFAPKADWSRKFPQQPEILRYLEGVVDQFDLGPFIEFGTEIAAAEFVESTQVWRLTLANGDIRSADVVVSATGQLNRPYTPAIEGLESYEGTRFHSARWNHDHDLTGHDVAVIGVGASAIQFVPEIVKTARSVTLFQRSVNYVAPKPDAEFSEGAKARFERLPLLRLSYRAWIWATFDARWLLFRKDSRASALARQKFDRGLRPLVSDALPEDAMIPDYPVGCKRLLISNDWYPTLLQPQVTVVTDPVDRIEAHSVVAGGVSHPADTLIFGTGFASTGFLAPMRVTGLGRRDLHDGWVDGAEAHLGMTVSGFPNLFLLYGPNTNLGHNSIIFMIERQVGYVLTCIRAMVLDGIASLDVLPEAQSASNRRLRRELNDTVWVANCHSWYKTASGRITNNWSGPTVTYWRRTLRPRFEDFRSTLRPGSPDRARTASSRAAATTTDAG